MDSFIKYLLESPLLKRDPNSNELLNKRPWKIAITSLLVIATILGITAFCVTNGELSASLMNGAIGSGMILFLLYLLNEGGKGKQESQAEVEEQNPGTGSCVIVPISWSKEWNLKYSMYFCQKNRFFREGTTHIGFYFRGEVIVYGKMIPTDWNKVSKKIDKSIKMEEGKIHEVSIFLLDKADNLDYYEVAIDESVSKPFDWIGSGRSPVQRQQYIALSELK